MMEELIKPQNLSVSREQLAMLTPYMVVLAGAMITLLAGVSKTFGRKWLVFALGIATAVVGLYAVAAIWGEPSIPLFNGMMAADDYTAFFNALLLTATGLVILASYPYLEKEKMHHIEYYSLMLFSCLGMMLLASALDLVVLFVALEMMSIGVYVLVGFRRIDVKSNEAAMKYFILGSVASAIMLLGVAFLYGSTGTVNINHLIEFARSSEQAGNPFFSMGAILVVSGFLFKVAVVPFHMWMPDVYEGAPISVTSFMTTALKAAAFASFMRVFMSFVPAGGEASAQTVLSSGFHDVLWVVAVATMFLGNVMALTQRNLKRMLAYSSIAHSGYILVGLIAGARSEYGYSSIILYLVAYVIMNLGAFAIVGLISESGDQKVDVQDVAGLGFQRPALGFAMAVFMFSMAGIPLTVGFAGKYLIFSSAVQAGETRLAVLAVLCSAISAYYYLRVIVYMYMKEPSREAPARFAFPALLVVFSANVATLYFGVFPTVLIEAAKKAAHL